MLAVVLGQLLASTMACLYTILTMITYFPQFPFLQLVCNLEIGAFVESQVEDGLSAF